MKRLLPFAAVGILIAAASGVAYVLTGSSAKPSSMVLQELYKAALTLTLVTVGGAALKLVADGVLESEKERRAAVQQEVDRRRAEAQGEADRRESIVREFVEIYSNFYSVKKLYHSARDNNAVYQRKSDDYERLMKELLKRSVELEGRFGAFKVLAVAFFGLRGGDYETTDVDKLKAALTTAVDTREINRLRLDLLGEEYDDWRHALEQDRRIAPGKDLWDYYEQLLQFFLKP